MKPIPVASAQSIAEEFGYHQVIIVARAVDQGEHVTTYGVDAPNCAVAAQIGDFLKFKVMGWAGEESHEDRRYEALTKALADVLDLVDRGEWLKIEPIARRAWLQATAGPKSEPS